MLQSESSILWGRGFPNIMNIYSKPSCDFIIICFPDETIFILLDCFTQLLPIQRLAKYDPQFPIECGIQIKYLPSIMFLLFPGFSEVFLG